MKASGRRFNLLTAHAAWFEERFGKPQPEHYLFPLGTPAPSDPTRPTTTMRTVWGAIRKKAKVDCRLHDLRHTVATKMAEVGVPESTIRPPDPEENELIPITAERRWNSDFALIPAG